MITWALDNDYTTTVTGFLSTDAVQQFVSTGNSRTAVTVHAALSQTAGAGTTWNGTAHDFDWQGADITTHLTPGTVYYMITKLGQDYRAYEELRITENRAA